VIVASQVVVRVADDPVWVTALISGGSALLGAVVGSVITSRAGQALAKGERKAQRLRRSHEAASELIESIYTLSRAVDYAIASTSPPLLAEASNDFSESVAPKLAWIEDEALTSRVRNHRTFAVAVGIGGTPKISRIPPPGLAEALGRHAEAILEGLEAHIQGIPLPAYREPPLRDIQGLIDWQN
jgi:hypothetical protein